MQRARRSVPLSPANGTCRLFIGSISALYRHRRRHAYCVDTNVLALKMTASARKFRRCVAHVQRMSMHMSIDMSRHNKRQCHPCEELVGMVLCHLWIDISALYRLCTGSVSALHLLRGTDVPVLKTTSSARALQRRAAHTQCRSIRMSIHMSIHNTGRASLPTKLVQNDPHVIFSTRVRTCRYSL